MCKVTFIYDEPSHLWEVEVSGVETELEAYQAFNAVILTAQAATPIVGYNKATFVPEQNIYKISVGIMI